MTFSYVFMQRSNNLGGRTINTAQILNHQRARKEKRRTAQFHRKSELDPSDFLRLRKKIQLGQILTYPRFIFSNPDNVTTANTLCIDLHKDEYQAKVDRLNRGKKKLRELLDWEDDFEDEIDVSSYIASKVLARSLPDDVLKEFIPHLYKYPVKSDFERLLFRSSFHKKTSPKILEEFGATMFRRVYALKEPTSVEEKATYEATDFTVSPDFDPLLAFIPCLRMQKLPTHYINPGVLLDPSDEERRKAEVYSYYTAHFGPELVHVDSIRTMVRSLAFLVGVDEKDLLAPHFKSFGAPYFSLLSSHFRASPTALLKHIGVDLDIHDRLKKPDGWWADPRNFLAAIKPIEERLGHFPSTVELAKEGHDNLRWVLDTYYLGTDVDKLKQLVASSLQPVS